MPPQMAGETRRHIANCTTTPPAFGRHQHVELASDPLTPWPLSRQGRGEKQERAAGSLCRN